MASNAALVLAVNPANSTLYLYRESNRTPVVVPCPEHCLPEEVVAVSNLGNYALVRCTPPKLLLFDLRTAKCVKEIEGGFAGDVLDSVTEDPAVKYVTLSHSCNKQRDVFVITADGHTRAIQCSYPKTVPFDVKFLGEGPRFIILYADRVPTQTQLPQTTNTQTWELKRDDFQYIEESSHPFASTTLDLPWGHAYTHAPDSRSFSITKGNWEGETISVTEPSYLGKSLYIYTPNDRTIAVVTPTQE